MGDGTDGELPDFWVSAVTAVTEDADELIFAIGTVERVVLVATGPPLPLLTRRRSSSSGRRAAATCVWSSCTAADSNGTLIPIGL